MHQLSDSEFIGSKIVMSDPNFDPYYKWLGISPADQPANHYRLLVIDPFEADGDVIESAAQRQISHVRTFALGKYSDHRPTPIPVLRVWRRVWCGLG